MNRVHAMWDDILNTLGFFLFLFSPVIAILIFAMAPRLIATIVILAVLFEIIGMTLFGFSP